MPTRLFLFYFSCTIRVGDIVYEAGWRTGQLRGGRAFWTGKNIRCGLVAVLSQRGVLGRGDGGQPSFSSSSLTKTARLLAGVVP